MPHTLETSDALNEVDELDDLIEDSQEQQDDDSAVEEADEVGQVEDADPDQDWAEDGTFIGQCELIEVPFRKTVKSKAMLRVAFDEECKRWRVGWFWETLLKDGSSQGVELSRSTVGEFGTRLMAVNMTLTVMANVLGDFDKRIADDLIKFRDKEWAPDPESEADLQDAVHEIETAGGSVGQAPTEEEQRAKAEAIFRDKMRAGADYLASCTLARIDSETVLKTAKAEEKAAAESLRAIADRGPERLPLLEYAEREKAKAESNGQAQSQPAKSVASDSWKSACVTELDLPKGVTQKLIDDGCDTIGRLEQRRADIAMKKEKWPRGIGKAAIDKIEEAVLTWLDNNRPIGGDETVDMPAAVDNTTADSEPVDDIGDVEARAGLLIKTGVVPNKESGAYQSGQEAFDRGWPITDCPYLPGDDQDQWLMGWSDAKEDDQELE